MLSLGNILIIALIFLFLFGAKKIPQIMYDLGLGVKAFKDALEGRDSLFTVNEKAVELNKKKSRKNTIKETNEPEVKKSKLKKL